MLTGVSLLEKPLTVIFFGIQGSGKGTQASLLSDFIERNSDLGIARIEMGERLRGFAAGNGKANKLVSETMNAGGLLPGFIPDYMLTSFFLQELSGDEHIILDGVARKVSQAVVTDEALTFFGRSDYHAVVLELSHEDATERLRLRGRSDDKSDKQIQERLMGFERDTVPAIQELERRGKTIHRLDGRPSIEEIHHEVLRVLKLS